MIDPIHSAASVSLILNVVFIEPRWVTLGYRLALLKGFLSSITNFVHPRRSPFIPADFSFHLSMLPLPCHPSLHAASPFAIVAGRRASDI